MVEKIFLSQLHIHSSGDPYCRLYGIEIDWPAIDL
jgi:hypothetical protein